MRDLWMKLDTKEKVRFVFSILCLVLLVVFTTLNWKDIEVNLLITSLKTPVSLLLLVTFIFGYTAGKWNVRVSKGKKKAEKEEEN
jgi:uncharacterized integral membrane protein